MIDLIDGENRESLNNWREENVYLLTARNNIQLDNEKNRRKRKEERETRAEDDNNDWKEYKYSFFLDLNQWGFDEVSIFESNDNVEKKIPIWNERINNNIF